MFDLENFLDFVRTRIADTDESLPCDPEDCAAVLGYLVALVPEYRLSQQAEAADAAARQDERKRAILAGFRRARGAQAQSNGNGNDADNDDDDNSTSTGYRSQAGGRSQGASQRTPPEAA